MVTCTAPGLSSSPSFCLKVSEKVTCDGEEGPGFGNFHAAVEQGGFAHVEPCVGRAWVGNGQPAPERAHPICQLQAVPLPGDAQFLDRPPQGQRRDVILKRWGVRGCCGCTQCHAFFFSSKCSNWGNFKWCVRVSSGWSCSTDPAGDKRTVCSRLAPVFPHYVVHHLATLCTSWFMWQTQSTSWHGYRGNRASTFTVLYGQWDLMTNWWHYINVPITS